MAHLLIFLSRLFALSLLSALALATAFASPVKTPHVEAELVARSQAFQPGQAVELALRLKIIDHWHTYWQNPGDSGLPTRLTWSLPAGFSAGAIAWPYPKKLPLGPLMNFGYEGEVLHLVTLQTPANFKIGETVLLTAKADWLVCSDVCIPESADLSMSLSSVSSIPLPDARWGAAFAKARAALPGTLGNWTTAATIADGKLAIDFSPPSGAAISIAEATFFPLREDLIANAGAQVLTKTGSGFRLMIPTADPVNASINVVDGVIVATNGWGNTYAGKAVAFSAPLVISNAVSPRLGLSTGVSGDSSSSRQMGLFAALLFALVGGLLLNLMPCVFPVLGIKIMSFARHAKSDPALLRKQGFAFLFGVLVSFWILAGILIALRSAGESIGWGFQLQSPLFVASLAVLFLLMALNLSGVFEMGLGLQSAAGNLHPRGRGTLGDAFFSGVLATVVATPCTAPMMGAALGFTLSQPAIVSILVFTAIALGMALPVMTLSLVPQWLRFLPKPGAWMITFRRFLAFPLFATVAWLTWVLGSQIGNDGAAKLLFGLVIIALAAWLYGHWQFSSPVRAIVGATLIALCGIAIAWPDASRIGDSVATTDDGWIPFSTQKIVELRSQRKAVFVDFTATWCITCQVNKRVALNQEKVVRRFKELDIVRMKADWTVQDPEITRALAEFGRNGVPLYVFYPAGGEPRIFPEILTPAIVLSGIEPGNASLATR